MYKPCGLALGYFRLGDGWGEMCTLERLRLNVKLSRGDLLSWGEYNV
jgi:hypothetical protein